MTKIQFLRTTKRFLLQVVKTRQNLIDHDEGKRITNGTREQMELINYWVPQMKSFDRVAKYIQRKKIQEVMRELIPSRNKIWFTKFDMLLVEAKHLQQPAHQLKLTYSC